MVRAGCPAVPAHFTSRLCWPMSALTVAPRDMKWLYHSRPDRFAPEAVRARIVRARIVNARGGAHGLCVVSMKQPPAAVPLPPVTNRTDGRGLAAAATAFLIWGLLPLYLKALHAVPVLQVTAHRL